MLPIASTAVPGSSAKAVRFISRRDEHERALGRVHGVAVDLEPRAAAEDDVELLAALVLLVLGHEPVALVAAVHAFVPNAVIPRWWRTGRMCVSSR